MASQHAFAELSLGIPALCRAVVGRTMRAILGFLRRRAREDGVMDGRVGPIVVLTLTGVA